MIRIEIITPSRKLLEVSCHSVVLPGALGELEVLLGHRPFLTLLHTGILKLKGLEPGALPFDRLMVSLGFAQIEPDFVRILCEDAALPSEVDVPTEQALLEKLQTQAIQSTKEDRELKLLTLQMERAAAKLQLLS